MYRVTAAAIRCPTLLTISASLLVVCDTTLLDDRNDWYSCKAIDCIVLSGTRFSWLRPVIGTREQAANPRLAVKSKKYFFMGVLFRNAYNAKSTKQKACTFCGHSFLLHALVI